MPHTIAQPAMTASSEHFVFLKESRSSRACTQSSSVTTTRFLAFPKFSAIVMNNEVITLPP